MIKDVIIYLMVVATILVVSFTADAATRSESSLVSDSGKQTIVCESIGSWGRTPKR